MLNDLE